MHLRLLYDIRHIRRRTFHNIYMIPDQQIRQCKRIMYLILIGHTDRHTVAERYEFLHHRHIEGDSRQSQRYRAMIRIIPDLCINRIRIDEITEIAVFDQYTFRPPRRT